MKKLASTCLALSFAPIAVYAQEACSIYEVRPNDGLRKIARAAYGSPNYQLIWDANRSVIGNDPNLIRLGAKLELPCEDGTLPSLKSAQSSEAAKAAAEAAEALAKAEADAKAAADAAARATTQAEQARADAEADAKAAAAEAARARADAEAARSKAEQARVTAEAEAKAAEEAVQAATTEAEIARAKAESEARAAELAQARLEEETAARARAEADMKAAQAETAAALAEAKTAAEAEARMEQMAKAAQAEAAQAKADAARAIAQAERRAAELESAAIAAARSEEIAQKTREDVMDLPPMTLVTGNDFAPYTDESLPGGGLFTQLVETAIARAAPDMEYRLFVINDWGSHVEDLLPANIFDAGFPWTRPNCEVEVTLSETDKFRCENFVFSDPYYEVVNGYYTLNDSSYSNAFKYTQFDGARICRPASYSLAPLTTAGLTEPTITLSRPEMALDCFRELAAGNVDVVSMGSKAAWEAIEKLELTSEIVENPNLAHIDTLNVMIHKSNPEVTNYMRMLNAGLQIMRDSGEWYHIVSTGLKAQAARHSN
ncbi:hypothetical protein [Actibacterium pelagium]|uniref:LysM domain-containing protein n=1 Tax=Actibacterium pelagium TaxID=2029103 RepID=A0A917A9T2_9RHOB|nr:hypothetical protein [Actibacterium pelagium]GGE37319.1 hypothetical protein GCM10011517_01310 [Actibacterium pelagium]